MEVKALNSTYVKIPITNEWKDHSLLNPYIAFTLFKTFNPEGRIAKKDLNANSADRWYYNRWIKTICSLGWAIEANGVYYLRSYQHVWRALGVKPCKYKFANRRATKLRYVTIQLSDLPEPRSKRVKKIKDLIQRSICDRHCSQRKHKLQQQQLQKLSVVERSIFDRQHKQNHRLKGKDQTKRKPVPLSAEGVQKLLGYKSHSAGQKARKRYFALSRKKSVLQVVPTMRGGVIFRNTCKEVLV